MAPGGSWWLLVAPGGSWWLLVALRASRWLPVAPVAAPWGGWCEAAAQRGWGGSPRPASVSTSETHGDPPRPAPVSTAETRAETHVRWCMNLHDCKHAIVELERFVKREVHHRRNHLIRRHNTAIRRYGVTQCAVLSLLTIVAPELWANLHSRLGSY